MRYRLLVKLFLLTIFLPYCLDAAILAGVSKKEITPQLGSPSAGYTDRKGAPMDGVHDALYASALYLDNGLKKIVFLSVDHLGFTYEMAQAITQRVQAQSGLELCEIYIGSSHTHCGGGAYLNMPMIGQLLAGRFNPTLYDYYINQSVEAILEAAKYPVEVKVGVGYGEAHGLSSYVGKDTKVFIPHETITILKIVTVDDEPFAILFNFPLHPTVLKSHVRHFSSDFVGYARDSIKKQVGDHLECFYFNGAQGDIQPLILDPSDSFHSAELTGVSLGQRVSEVWKATKVQDTLTIDTLKHAYTFKPQPNSVGFALPVVAYDTEMNALVFNSKHAFITIPGELSIACEEKIAAIASNLNFEHVSILGLCNDAHGYILSKEAFLSKSSQSQLSWGGQDYGQNVIEKSEKLLKQLAD
jgi:hypothetical protein